MIDENFLKVAGKSKMRANMPNGSAGRKCGQIIPPVKVTLKKISRNGKDSNLKIEKLKKNQNFSLSLGSKKPDTSKHPYGIAEQNLTPLKKRSGRPRKNYKLTDSKTWKNGKIQLLVNKDPKVPKTSAENSSYIIDFGVACKI